MVKHFFNMFVVVYYFKEDLSASIVLGPVLNKSLEFNILYDKEWDWFYFFTSLGRKRDHAGLKIELGLPFIAISLSIHDSRHWNYDKDRWYLPEEDLGIDS